MLEDSDDDEQDQQIRETLKTFKFDVKKVQKQANEKKGLLAGELEKQLIAYGDGI